MPDLSKRLLVLLVTVAGLVAVERIPIPGVDTEAVAMWTAQAGWTPSALSVGALGVMPWLTAAVLLELLALFVPSWREIRTSGAEARAVFERFTPWAWLVLAAIQALAMAMSLEIMRVGNTPLVGEPGIGFRLVVVLSLVAGSAVCVGLCQWCARDGLGAGLLVALGLMWTEEPWIWWMNVQLGEVTLLTPAVLLAVAVGLLALRTPGRTLRLSVAGLVPLGVVVQALSIYYVDLSNPVLLLLGVLVPTALLGVLFQMPDLVAALKGVPQPLVQRDLTTGVLVNTVVVAGLVYGVVELGLPTFGVELFVVPAVLWDLASEWRARSSGLSTEVWQLHRMYAVEPALDALNAAGIPAASRGDRTRSLLHFFGPYVPVGILVEASRADEARAVLARRLATGAPTA
ncbi:MAG: hypothetical protein R3F61_09535 [Myxococcota bacterium]